MLLLQKPKAKEDEKEADTRKSYRALGVKACSFMQGMKASDAKFLISNEVADPAYLGVFENSFMLSNYENFLKKEESGDEVRPEDEDFDPRTKQVRKRIPNYEMITAVPSKLESDEIEF